MGSHKCFVGEKIWADLVQACKALGYLPTNGWGSSPQYKRLVLDPSHHLLTFEVERFKFPCFPNEGCSTNMATQRILSNYFSNVRLDIIDLDTNLYFNFWVSNIDQGYEMAASEQVCV